MDEQKIVIDYLLYDLLMLCFAIVGVDCELVCLRGVPGRDHVVGLREQALAVVLLQTRVIVHQKLLLLGKVARLAVKIAPDESSGASGNFHKVLRELLAISFVLVVS